MDHQQRLHVVALAGRRIDDPTTNTPRFPLDAAPKVKASLTDLFIEHRFNTLVCSAACGADLLALDVADACGMKIEIILPYTPKKFRVTSVVDRPGNWGELYDTAIDRASASGHLHIIGTDNTGTYGQATHAIIRLASRLATGRASAAIVWEGKPRGEDDATEEFRRLATTANMRVHQVFTC